LNESLNAHNSRSVARRVDVGGRGTSDGASCSKYDDVWEGAGSSRRVARKEDKGDKREIQSLPGTIAKTIKGGDVRIERRSVGDVEPWDPGEIGLLHVTSNKVQL
jgi:hypothetical protein